MKRFYKQAGLAPVADGHGVTVDDRLVMTPGKRDLVVPSAALAAAIAAGGTLSKAKFAGKRCR